MTNSFARIPNVALLIESSRASGRCFLNGIAAFTHYHGPWSFHWETGGLETAISFLKSSGIDGIIMRDVDQVQEVLDLRIPTVVLGHKRGEFAGVVNVVTNSRRVGQLAADHLVQCGFKKFAFVGIAQRSNGAAGWPEAREEYFSDAIRRIGCEVETYHLPEFGRGEWMKARYELAKWLESLQKPVGIMACNDDCGVQVMESCKILGLAIPDMVGLIGVDNDEIICGLSNPPMTSIALQFERAGYEAAESLSLLMQGRKPKTNRIVVPASHVFTRQSTDYRNVFDPTVSRALRYICDHAHEEFDVTDVARVAGVSRRVLERRFRQHINSTILERIRNARTEQICRMLVETNSAISDIAYSLGFENPQHFARYFRSARGMSPTSFREAFRVPKVKDSIRLDCRIDSHSSKRVGGFKVGGFN